MSNAGFFANSDGYRKPSFSIGEPGKDRWHVSGITVPTFERLRKHRQYRGHAPP
jgi:hypothetical protein